MKNFTVWFRVGLDFKETIEAEDARDAERRIGDEAHVTAKGGLSAWKDYCARLMNGRINNE